jgi:GNAT superfamily N-acetyltransferase
MKQWSNEHAKLTIGPSAALPGGMEGVMEVTGVWTDPEHRKQGYATELMKQACDAADIEKIVLMLQPKPFGPDGLQALEVGMRASASP